MVSRPHGGKLVDRTVRGRRREALLGEAWEIVRVDITFDRAIDVEDIAYGVFSPLEGFLVEDDYLSVLKGMRLSDGTPWTIPVILDVDKSIASMLRQGDDIALFFDGKPLAIMRVEDIYAFDKKLHAERVFKTTDARHPGVAKLSSMREILIGGRIDLLNTVYNPLERYTLWPKETRVLFREKGWRTIAAFQTRNVPHLGHEYVQKAALSFVDGLFINPLAGWKKRGDYRDEVILEAYKALIEHYYPRNVVVLAALRMNMWYAGPREAVHHAIARKNFGATHFIVGRDHAGVGDYYGPYEAWEIFSEFPDLGITPLFIREAFYCRKCMGMANEKTCPHSDEYRVRISGTKIRSMLLKGEKPPETMMRKEVSEAVLSFENPFV
ncbi:MAG: sulfate adenylyltransferase [Desulfurococcales archaeon]|nr:sulfate adenylyltransferase [Desulfurococcales archaeon]